MEDADEKMYMEKVDQWKTKRNKKMQKGRKETETRQSRFSKKFPNASVYADGTIDICPLYVDKTLECKALEDVVKERDVVKECIECEREFWGTEV